MNKKGFTLIELLAVIVILAIIALIATPQILKVITDSREASNRSSIDGIYSAIQYYYSDTMNFSGTSRFSYTNNTLVCKEGCDVTDENISVTGSMGSDAIGWGYIDRSNTKVAVYKTGKCYYKINGGTSKTEAMTKENCESLVNG